MSARDKAAPPTGAVFLERQSYRRRRLRDAARMLPLLGVILLMVPLLWPDPQAAEMANGGGEPVAMSGAIVYIFSIWAGLIVLSALFGIGARYWAEGEGPNDPEQG